MIDGDSGFTAANGVTAGAGTPFDPYLIADWSINATASAGIRIRNTRANFEVRDVRVTSPIAGIELVNVSEGAIRNYTSEAWNHHGVHIEASRNVTVTDSTFVENYEAIHATSSTGLLILGNSVTKTLGFAGEGMVIESSSLVSISSNTVQGASGGIHLLNCTLSGISDNWIFGATAAIGIAYSRSVSVSGNRFNGTVSEALSILYSSDLDLAGNTGEGTISAGYAADLLLRGNAVQGIGLFQVTNASLWSNPLTSGGIALDGDALSHFASHSIPVNNSVNGLPVRYYKNCANMTVDGTAAGQLLFVNCSDVRVANASFNDSGLGVGLYFVQRAAVVTSTFSASNFGVTLRASQEVRVENSTFTANDIGLGARMVDGLLVRGNGFLDNGKGVILEQVSDATLFGNRFIGNLEHRLEDLSSPNQWDGGYPTGGNYWDDYAMEDRCGGPNQDVCAGSDGFGDVPHGPDRYPTGPPNQRPTASFTVTPEIPVVGGYVRFDVASFSDTDGQVVSFTWELGDGDTLIQQEPWGLGHHYSAVGNYSVNLTMRDNSGGETVVTRVVVVTPDVPLELTFTVNPILPLAGEPVTFNATASWDPYGNITDLNWTFGDDGAANGVVVQHAFAGPGTFAVTLRANSNRGIGGAFVQYVLVRDTPLEWTSISHSSGFELPAPADWAVQEDVVQGDITLELMLLGPAVGSGRTNVVVETDYDAASREDRGYLQAVFNQTVAGIREDRPGVRIAGSPTFRQVAGLLALVGLVNDPTSPGGPVQTLIILTNALFARYWVLILTTSPEFVLTASALFEHMVSGFRITLEPPSFPLPLAQGWAPLVLIVLVGVVAAFGVLEIRRRRTPTNPPQRNGATDQRNEGAPPRADQTQEDTPPSPPSRGREHHRAGTSMDDPGDPQSPHHADEHRSRGGS